MCVKILFMGTGAADWNISNRQGDEFFRRFTTVMINDDLILDFNDEALDYLEKNGKSVENVKNILITHTHSDHYSNMAVNEKFGTDTNICFDKGAEERIGKTKAVHKVLPLYSPIKIGRYTVIATEANHSVEDSMEKPLHYIISDGEKCIFWGCDGAWLLNKPWHEIRKHKYDLVVFDGTLYDKEGDYRIFEHNNLHMITEMSATFRELELMKPNSKIMISHMSRWAQYEHSELEKYLKPYEIYPAFDGLEIEI